MNIGYLRFALLLIYGFASCRLLMGVSADQVDGIQDNPSVQLSESLIHNDNEITKLEPDKEEYYYEHDDYGLSGDYEIEFPRVAFSTKPQNMPMAPFGERRRDGKRNRLGKKRNPCLKKYKDFCIHGVCNYLRDLREPSCTCLKNYHGERCHLYSQTVAKEADGYNRTVALAVVGWVLSLLGLVGIVTVMVARYRKKCGSNLDGEDKVKLEAGCTPLRTW